MGDKTFKVHLDGYDLSAVFKTPSDEWPRRLFPYWGDDGEFLAIRYEQWKVVFKEQRATGLAGIWEEPFVELRAPHSSTSVPTRSSGGHTRSIYWGGFADNLYLVPAAALGRGMLMTFPSSRRG